MGAEVLDCSSIAKPLGLIERASFGDLVRHHGLPSSVPGKQPSSAPGLGLPVERVEEEALERALLHVLADPAREEVRGQQEEDELHQGPEGDEENRVHRMSMRPEGPASKVRWRDHRDSKILRAADYDQP